MNLSNIVEGDNVNDFLNPILRGIGHFGEVEFKVSRRQVRTFRDYRRTTRARFAKHDLLLQKPQLEYLGQDLTEVTFKIQLVRELGVEVEAEAKKLRKMCEEGGDYALVIGGEVIGRFVIEQIDETAQFVDNHGNILVAEMELTLREYAINLK